MKIHLLTAEHFHVPGVITKAFADPADAAVKAVELTNVMLKDDGHAPNATRANWRKKVARLARKHDDGCYVDITQIAVHGAAPDPLPALQAAEAFMSGFEDDETQEGIAERLATVRAAIAGLEGRA